MSTPGPELDDDSEIGRGLRREGMAPETKAKETRLKSGEPTRVKIRNEFGGRLRHMGPLFQPQDPHFSQPKARYGDTRQGLA